MSYPERKKIILELLQQKGKVLVQEIEEAFHISQVTARRDLDALAKENLIERVHGGALQKEKSFFIAFQNKNKQQSTQKEQIGRLAAQFINNGDTIFLDCGSTVWQVCPFLKQKKNLRVITNSIPIMLTLMEYPDIQLNIIGGELDQARRAVHGSVALEHIEKYKADKALIGIDGMSLQRGLSAQGEKEQSMSLHMAQHAQKVFVLADSSKFEKEAYLKIGEWSLIDTLITDDQINPAILQQYVSAGIQVVNSDTSPES